MNKFIRTAAAILLSALALCSCAETAPQSSETAYEPTQSSWEAADNCNGMRFTFSLRKLSDRVNGIMKDNSRADEGGQTELLLGEWEVLSGGLVDDKGVKYTSYYQKVGIFSLTAAAEDESGKVINLACGCNSKLLEDEDIKSTYLLLAAVLTQSAAGSGDDELSTIKDVFEQLLGGGDDELYHDGILFTRLKDDDSINLIISPITAQNAADHQIKSYEKLIAETTDAEQPVK